MNVYCLCYIDYKYRFHNIMLISSREAKIHTLWCCGAEKIFRIWPGRDSCKTLHAQCPSPFLFNCSCYQLRVFPSPFSNLCCHWLFALRSPDRISISPTFSVFHILNSFFKLHIKCSFSHNERLTLWKHIFWINVKCSYFKSVYTMILYRIKPSNSNSQGTSSYQYATLLLHYSTNTISLSFLE